MILALAIVCLAMSGWVLVGPGPLRVPVESDVWLCTTAIVLALDLAATKIASAITASRETQ